WCAAVAVAGGADRRLHRTWRAVRESRAPADYHFDVALCRPWRIARTAGLPHRTDCDRLYRHHFADRHREKERRHDGGLRTRRRATAGFVPPARDPRRLSCPFPADPDDHAFSHAGRSAVGNRDWSRVGTATPAGHHHYRRTFGVAGAHALNEAGHLSVARPIALQPRW